MTEPSNAVFLSYASQDAQAARKVCEALRAAGIEVWFDQSELRGGDAWDRSIRAQIKSCALFIPVISKNTHDRDEGYFRLEWKLAVDRCHLMAADRTFLVPIVIDDSPDDDGRVPERFREVQWTRLAGGATPPAFVERVRRLLSHEIATARVAPPIPTSHAAGSVTSAPRGLARRRTPLLLGAIGTVVLLALSYFGLEKLRRPAPVVQGAASIAVLPLANESGEASQQYFSDGISEDLITALSQFPGLKVIGRTSAFQFRDSKEDSRSIGAKLGVAHLLEGSVRHSGEMVRVSAELIDTADGSTEWSERYDRPFRDLFALQDEITRAVAGALRAKLLQGEHAATQSERPPGGSLEAYNAMLEGRYYHFRATEADIRNAIKSFTRATEIDPRYALAWSGVARSWMALAANFLGGAPAHEAYAKAHQAVNRALALEPDLATAHVTRGIILQSADLDWHGAEAEFHRALALAPNDADAKFNLANLLAALGQVDAGIELTQQALAIEPLRANWYSWLSSYLTARNRLDEAERSCRAAIRLQPEAVGHHQTLTLIEIQRGQAPAALEAAEQEPPGIWRDVALAQARQIGDDRGAADAALRTLLERYAHDAPYQIAEVYALRHDVEATFEWLDRARSDRDPGIGNLLFDPIILRYRDDPRFAAFCRKIGLPVPGDATKST